MAEQQNHSKKKLVFLSIGLIFLLLLIGFFLYWFLILRFEESTDDAYVNGNQITITSQINGYIQTINVDETEIVNEGKIIATLDSTDQTIAFETAKHNLAKVVRETVGLFERVDQLKAEKKIKETDKKRALQDLNHRKNLLDDGSVSLEQYEHADESHSSSQYALDLVEHQLQAAMAEVNNTTIFTHPRVEEAKDRIRKSFVDLQRCQIYAPSHGMIAMRQAQVGEAVYPGKPLMFLIPLDQIWVNANFKETQLENVRIGQPVKMTADLYGDAEFNGKVVGLWPGTGSVFSVIPPQNATGNWIKIVQRIPVRISLDSQEISKFPLRLGMSMQVTVDISDQNGERIPPLSKKAVLYETDIYKQYLEGVEEIIEKIIKENLYEQ